MFTKIPCAGESTAFACQCLPNGYDLYERIDLTKDKKTFNAIMIWSVAALVVMIAAGLPEHSFLAAFDMPTEKVLICVAAMAIGLLAYILLHEAVHGVFIWFFTGSKPSFGFDLKSGMAYAGSTWFFKKWPYIVIALAPVVIWGIVLAVLCSKAEECYFWYIYAIQIMNITGAAGDLYVTYMVSRMPSEVLATDSGTAMNFYMKK
ncbi:MAG: DUF3267 domain-containing protein [Firmicutes bacterium]|nr:DUF3267 domain-containing protein [Bacillota bacterium]